MEKQRNKKATIVIPSYEPKERLVKIIRQLRHDVDNPIVVVNDGSSKDYQDIFLALEKFNVTVLTHQINLGKGAAIKTAIKYQLKHYPNAVGIVTADSDGQHSIKDILKIVRQLENSDNHHEIILGVRSFEKRTTPPKSYYGNLLTSKLFQLVSGQSLTDTQTGLRGLPQNNLKRLSKIDGGRFEYEMNVLLSAKSMGLKLNQIPITTIYENENSGTHFHPIKDSYLVYQRFLKFIGSSLISSLVDISLFTIIIKFVFPHINMLSLFIATVFARSISGLVNYKINQKKVFKNQSKKDGIKYFILFISQLTLSYLILIIMNHFLPYSIYLKITVDVLIFFISYKIQNNYIFNTNQKEVQYEK